VRGKCRRKSAFVDGNCVECALHAEALGRSRCLGLVESVMKKKKKTGGSCSLKKRKTSFALKIAWKRKASKVGEEKKNLIQGDAIPLRKGNKTPRGRASKFNKKRLSSTRCWGEREGKQALGKKGVGGADLVYALVGVAHHIHRFDREKPGKKRRGEKLCCGG